mgnify:FL=1
MNLKNFFTKEDEPSSNRDWKEKNKRYLRSLQKFLDATDRIKDEDIKQHIITQMLKCDLALTEIAEKEIQKSRLKLEE